MNLRLLECAPARADTIFRSKAVGEPPLLLATSVWNALKDAIGTPELDLPATPERVLMALRRKG
jgi:xanthine dehydrogenase large subunit